jgi:hypothetical protein
LAMMKTVASGVRLYSLAVQQQAERQAMAFRSTISPESAPTNLN